jgi:hypothetical protein
MRGEMMVRRASNWWNCVSCGAETDDGVICYRCAEKERNKQRAESGSLTQKQLSYIEYLISSLDSQTTAEIIFGAVPDYGGELESLTSNQAGDLIPALKAYTEDNPPKCKNCNNAPVEKFGYCQLCYDKIFYNGAAYTQCAAKKSNGEQCGHKGHFENGYCHIHQGWTTK